MDILLPCATSETELMSGAKQLGERENEKISKENLPILWGITALKIVKFPFP